MNSAAKLRNRGIAIAGATAIVMTSFGPAAFAWEAPGANSNAAKTGSIGLVDTSADAGTQGATAVVAGQNNQAIGDLQLVVPATYSAGDYIDLTLTQDPDPAKRATWSGTPSLDIAGPFASNTEVQANTSTAGDAAESKAADFTPGSGQTSPKAPSVTPTVVGGSYGDRILRLTFNSTADASQFDAKFSVRVKGAKVNLGSDVVKGTNGEIAVAAAAFDKSGAAKTDFFRAGTGANNVTVPAAISGASLTVGSASLAKSDDAQALPDVTVNSAASTGFGPGAVSFDVTGLSAADTTSDVSITFYDAAGSVIGDPVKKKLTITTNTATLASGTLTSAQEKAVKAVVSGAIVRPGSGSSIGVELKQAGSAVSVPAQLTVTGANQTDIAPPTALTKASVGLIDNSARLSGPSRYETAVAAASQLAAVIDSSNASNTPEVDNLVVASGANFADALSAGYLAQTKDAPIVLTQPNQLPSVVSDFVQTHGVKRVFIVGGAGAVSKEVADALANMTATDLSGSTANRKAEPTAAKVQVTRLAGDNRFATNRIVNTYAAASAGGVDKSTNAYGKASANTAIVANGMTPWDALAAGAMVAGPNGKGVPVVLTTAASTLQTDAAAQLSGLDIGHTIYVGGYGVLPKTLEGASGGQATRLGGDNRFQTAEAIAKFLTTSKEASATNATPGFGYPGPGAYLANGGINASGQPTTSGWADALAVAPLVAKNSGVLAMTAASTLPSDTKDLLAALPATFTSIVPVGGADVVNNAVVNAARVALG